MIAVPNLERKPVDTEQLQALCLRRGLSLRCDEEGLTLCDGALELRGDFTRMLPRLKQGRLQQELVVKAAKIKGASGPLLAVDATAGLGEDSLLLAAAGFHVELFERNPVIAALLSDALERASENPELSEAVGRMRLRTEDSIDALPRLEYRPDVVLLDPMFPQRRKSASVKKKLQMLQKLEDPCAAEDELLDAALAAEPRKLIVKRPPKGPYLAGRKPSYSLTGKAVRYDVTAFAR